MNRRRLLAAAVLSMALAPLAAHPPSKADDPVAGPTSAPATHPAPEQPQPPKPDPRWRFDPMTGLPIDKPHEVPLRSPKQVALAFFSAYGKADRQAMADCLALQQLLADIMTEGVMKAEGLQPQMKKVIRDKLAERATKVLVPVILDILTSPEMRKEYPPPADLSAKKLDAMFREEIIGDEARLIPSRAIQGESMIIRFKKIDDRWRITHLPGVMGE